MTPLVCALFEPRTWPEMITWRDAKSAFFKGSRASCNMIVLVFLGAKFPITSFEAKKMAWGKCSLVKLVFKGRLSLRGKIFPLRENSPNFSLERKFCLKRCLGLAGQKSHHVMDASCWESDWRFWPSKWPIVSNSLSFGVFLLSRWPRLWQCGQLSSILSTPSPLPAVICGWGLRFVHVVKVTAGFLLSGLKW